MAEGMTVSELGDAVGMTPRNIRAYQSKGLLFAPVISGRVALYSGAHVARLQLIASLQREGFTLAAIKRLIETRSSHPGLVADRRRRFRDGSPDTETGLKTLSTQGVPLDVISALQLDAANAARELGSFLRERLGHLDDEGLRGDLARVAVQLSATAFEIAFLDAATCARPGPGSGPA